MHYRSFLTTVLTLALAGCVASGRRNGVEHRVDKLHNTESYATYQTCVNDGIGGPTATLCVNLDCKQIKGRNLSYWDKVGRNITEATPEQTGMIEQTCAAMKAQYEGK